MLFFLRWKQSMRWIWLLFSCNIAKLIATWLFSVTRLTLASLVSTAVVWQHCFIVLSLFVLCTKRLYKAQTKWLPLRQPPSGQLLSKVADDFSFQIATSPKSLIITNYKQLPSVYHAHIKYITWTSNAEETKIPGHLLKSSLCCP